MRYSVYLRVVISLKHELQFHVSQNLIGCTLRHIFLVNTIERRTFFQFPWRDELTMCKRSKRTANEQEENQLHVKQRC